MAEPTEGKRDTWLDRHLWQIQPVRDVLAISGVIGLVWLGYKLSVVTVPLLLAITLAYLFEPVVKHLTKTSWISRDGAAAAIIAAAVLAVVVPVGVGGTFAAVQGVNLAISVRDDADALANAIRPENRENTAVQGRVSPGFWSWVRDVIVREQDKQAERAAALAEQEAERELAIAEDAAEQAVRSVTGEAPPVDVESQEDAARDANAAESAALAQEAAAEEAVAQGGPRLAPVSDPSAGPDAGMQEPLADWDEAGDTAEQAGDGPAGDGADPSSDQGPDQSAPRPVYRPELRESTDLEQAAVIVIDFLRNNAQAITQRVFQTGAGAFEALIGMFTSLAFLAFTLFLTAFFFFFFSTGYARVLQFGESLIPDKNRELTLHLLKRFDAAIAGFVRGRLTIAFIQAIVFTIGYWAIGVPAPILLGVGVALLSIVPYAALVGIPVSIVLIWIEGHTGFRGEIWWVLGAPLAFYFVGQALDDYVWTPLIQGKSTGMDTPTILCATLAGGALMGVYGLLLAIPLAACLKISLQELFWPRFKQWAAGEKPDFLPLSKD
ncbi:MAG: AI-2E family transporter [Planctomycetota bacterium]